PLPPLAVSGPRARTIVTLLTWCRDNLSHYLNGASAQNMQDTWHYRGFPPVERMIAGTHNTLYDPSHKLNFSHWTAGCHGTVGFLRAILRTVNIPVQYTTAAEHAQPYFMTEGLYLSHGDDPYSDFAKQHPPATAPPFPVADMLIGEALHEEWFGAAVSEKKRLQNVGRRTTDLALPTLPVSLLYAYCQDKALGRSHAEGDVFGAFKPYGYTLADLRDADLWQRMDAKIAAFGGCAAIPRPR
ncbi:MAG: hypothetical protein QOH13_1210, partial [Thermoleophilaceae bacterium]|nr:hypothetical protein [Thermoleophilaceae bacterium]